MPFIPASQAKEMYDVIVVGSGAAGGQVAYTLTMDGAKVLMLEAGRNYDPAAETPMFQDNSSAPLRGQATTDKPFGFYDSTIDGGWNVPGEPYTNLSDDPHQKFRWWRSRMVGGRTNHWGRHALRNGPYDFKPYRRDGLGFDWPISYEDVAPYYDKVERLIGVYGNNDGYENTPDSPPGVLLPPPAPRAGELLAKKHAQTLGIPIIAIHRAVLSTRLDSANIPQKLHPNNPRAQRILKQEMESRSACFWATDCGRGCSIRANYQSTTVHLPPALATGNLDVVTDAMVREVLLNDHNRAEGVVYIDRKTRTEHRVKARVVVLAAGACESVRILLNSNDRHPEGLANRSGKVGKYIMDTVGASFSGQVPALENLEPHNEDGAGGLHVYAPWWLYQNKQLGFARGYHIEFGTGRKMPGPKTFAGMDWITGGSYGAQFKSDARRYYGSFVGFTGRGEMIPNEDSYCQLDPEVKDKWGIPVLRFAWKWSQHELRQAAHMQSTFANIISAMGGRFKTSPDPTGVKAIEPGGSIIHEVGGAIMGERATDSVTNRWGQTWDIGNLFIVDGATFCSNADKNPTLTIMALAWRTGDYILDAMKRGDV